jgi:hypothetical protein
MESSKPESSKPESPKPESPLIEKTPVINESMNTPHKTENTPNPERTYYTYILSLVVVAIVIGLLYHSYSCYCTNQDIYEDAEGFIEKTVKSGTDSDLSFDVDNQVNQLIQKQERYLTQIQKNK